MNNANMCGCIVLPRVSTSREMKHLFWSHYLLTTLDALGGQPSWDTLPPKGVVYGSETGKQLTKEVVDGEIIAWFLLETTQSHGIKVSQFMKHFIRTYTD